MDIDFVYAWSGKPPDSWDNGLERYNHELQYSLRSCFKYANWFQRIYILINSDVPPPDWIYSNDDRIEIVDRCQLFPNPENCPTSNPFAVYSVMHLIPGLSEYYVVLDDDYFFIRPVEPEYFFDSDTKIPIARCKKETIPIYPESKLEKDKIYQLQDLKIEYENLFIKKIAVREGADLHGEKSRIKNELNIKFPQDKFCMWMHLPCPMRKSFAEEFALEYPGYLEFIRSHKNRIHNEELIMIYYQYLYDCGKLEIGKRYDRSLVVHFITYKTSGILFVFLLIIWFIYIRFISRAKVINMNDRWSKNRQQYERQKRYLKTFYEKLYPEKPDYEKES